MKKLISIVLCLSMLLGMAAFVSAETDTNTAKVTIADYASTNSWADGSRYYEVVMDNIITVTASDDGQYNGYTNLNQWRIYQSENGTVTVAADDGYTIDTVKITYDKYKNGVLTNGDSQVTSGTAVSVNAGSITFGVGNTGTATNGQVRITAIEVTYHSDSDGDSEDTFPTTGVAYKLSVYQGTLGKTYYFNGSVASTYYLGTTDDVTGAVDVYLETAEGGYYLYFYADSAKTYIDLYKNNTYYNTKLTTTPSVIYTWDETYKTLTADVEGVKCYIGTYTKVKDGTSTPYSTLGGSQYTYITNETSFASTLTLSVSDPENSEPQGTEAPSGNQDPAADSTLTITEAITLGSGKENDTYTEGKYYVTGTIKSVTNATFGNMYIEDENGNELFIYGTYSADGSTRYDSMDVKPAQGDTITVYGVIGKYSDKAQMKDAWITAHTPASSEGNGDEDDTPVTLKGQKWGVYQENLKKVLYFTGATANASYYLATTEDKDQAADVYVEEVDGGYRLYFYADSVKTYIDLVYVVSGDKTYVNICLTETPTAVYTYDETYETYVAVVDAENDVKGYIGAYYNYETLSGSKYDYIGTSYPAVFNPTVPNNEGDNTGTEGGNTGTEGGNTGTEGGNTGTEGGNTGDDDNDNGTTEPITGIVKLNSVKNGDRVLIYFKADGKVVTGEKYTHTSYKDDGSVRSSKDELVLDDVKVSGGVMAENATALWLNVSISGGKVTFKTDDGKYLYADGTNVRLASEKSEYTEFVLEKTSGGYFIKCANATYNDNAQYLEVYSGYLTVYGKYETSDASIYTFQFYAEGEVSANTGDSFTAVVAAALVASMAGVAVLIKKKEF